MRRSTIWIVYILILFTLIAGCTPKTDQELGSQQPDSGEPQSSGIGSSEPGTVQSESPSLGTATFRGDPRRSGALDADGAN